MFVQAIDGKLYEDSIYEGDGFYWKCEGIEQPEIVIKYSPTSTLSSSRQLAIKRFKELGMSVRLNSIDTGEEFLYPFPPDWKGVFKGCKWGFDFNGPIAIPHSYKCKVDYPTTDVKFLAWTLPFPMKTVLDYTEKNKFNSLLISFMVGYEVVDYSQLTSKIYNKINKNINDQLMNLSGIGREIITLKCLD